MDDFAYFLRSYREGELLIEILLAEIDHLVRADHFCTPALIEALVREYIQKPFAFASQRIAMYTAKDTNQQLYSKQTLVGKNLPESNNRARKCHVPPSMQAASYAGVPPSNRDYFNVLSGPIGLI